jgi:hypothetical protein
VFAGAAAFVTPTVVAALAAPGAVAVSGVAVELADFSAISKCYR